MKEKKTEISERISQFINYLNINRNEFAKKLKYGRSQTIYDILNGKSAPSYDFFNRLYLSEYSDKINPIWLLTGKGSMFRIGGDDMDAGPDPLDAWRSEVDRLHGLLSEKDRQIASLLEQQEKLIGKLTE